MGLPPFFDRVLRWPFVGYYIDSCSISVPFPWPIRREKLISGSYLSLCESSRTHLLLVFLQPIYIPVLEYFLSNAFWATIWEVVLFEKQLWWKQIQSLTLLNWRLINWYLNLTLPKFSRSFVASERPESSSPRAVTASFHLTSCLCMPYRLATLLTLSPPPL